VPLDFIPNAVHAPMYTAVRTGRDRAEGVRLQIRKPAGGPDALKLVASGRVDLGVLDIHDLAIAREQGTDLVAIAALVARPLAALIARGGIRRPRELEGRVVGVSGLPSDPAFLRAIVEHDGGDYERVRQVTIGFSAVSRMLSGRVDAVPAFWNAEGVAFAHRGLDVREFRVDDYGAPPYPEVVLITSRKTLEQRRDRLARALAAIEQGLRDTVADPDAAARDVARAAETSDVGLVRAQLDAVAPVFAEGLELERDVLERWADFDARIGIVERRPDVQSAFDFTLLEARAPPDA
jgi:putative hydroxymethylpyrimidine transport system substrate-binding protein